MDEYGGQEQLGMVGPQAGALHGMSPCRTGSTSDHDNSDQMIDAVLS